MFGVWNGGDILVKKSDLVFGELEFNSMWQKNEKIFFLSNEYEIKLFVEEDEDGEFTDIQREAYKKFLDNYELIMQEIEQAILEYYQSVFQEYRDMYEDEADEYAPYVEEFTQLKGFIKPQSIIVANFGSERIINYLFKTKWDLEYGIGIRLVNEKIAIVGIQNDVL